MTTVADIYAKCGLEDPDAFMHRQHAENVRVSAMFAAADPRDVTDGKDPHGRLYRQIGATTWMAAHAAQQVLRGRSVLVISDHFSHGKDIRMQIFDMCRTMLEEAPIPSHLIEWVDQGGFTSSNKPFKGTPFHNERWKERAVRRIQGPFVMTREIRYEHDKYVAYAEDDERLMTVAPEGLMEFMSKRPDVIAVGWKFSGFNAAPFGVVPTLRGAFGLDVTPTVNKGWVTDLKRVQKAAWALR